MKRSKGRKRPHYRYAVNAPTPLQAVGLSPKDIFSETGLVVGDQDFAALRAEVDRLTAENAQLTANYNTLKEEKPELETENKLLQMEIKYKDEIIAVHNRYTRKPTEWVHK